MFDREYLKRLLERQADAALETLHRDLDERFKISVPRGGKLNATPVLQDWLYGDRVTVTMH